MTHDPRQPFRIRWGGRSLPVRLMLAIAGVPLASIACTTALFVAHQRQGLIAELERQADLALGSLTLAAASLDSQVAEDSEPVILPSSEVEALQSRGAIFSAEGILLAGIGNTDGDRDIGQPSLSVLEQFGQELDTWYLWQPNYLLSGRRVNARGIGLTPLAESKIIVVEISTTALNEHLRQALLDATQVAMGAGAVSLLLALLLSRTIAGSLKQMVETTERIALGQFTERLPLNRGGYELSVFARSFNLMAAQLQKTIARQRALVRYSLDAIVVLDRQGHVVEVNPCAENLLGAGQDILESRFSDWAFASPWSEQFQAVLVAISRGEDSDLLGRWQEIEVQTRSGHRFPAELSITHTNVQGSHLFTITLRDITERHQVEIRLQQSEARFRQIVHSAPIGIALVDVCTQRIQQVNPALCAIVGYDESELLGLPFGSLGLDVPTTSFQASFSDCSPYSRQTLSSAETIRKAATSDLPIMVVSSSDKANAVSSKTKHEPELPLSGSHSEQSYQHPQGHAMWIALIVTALAGSGETAANLVMIEDITEHKQVEFQLRHEALHDPLTGLANRALMLKRLSRACDRFHSFDSGQDFAVLFLDCDRFKSINDTLGHEVGDRLLIALARRLEDCVREGDTVARLGGDEFTILLAHIHEPEEAIHVADRILDSLSRPLDLQSHHLTVSASIGIVNSHLRYRTAEAILKDADVAMYQAKTLGRACHVVFCE
ncbi:MAG: diguanylate cyclase [Cyanobacteria bacterium P01_E01_bin.34]